MFFFPQTSIHVMAMRLDIINEGCLRKKNALRRFQVNILHSSFKARVESWEI